LFYWLRTVLSNAWFPLYTYISLQTVLYINRRIRVEGMTQGSLAQDLVDRRAVGTITEPLLTITEAHAELDDGTNPSIATMNIEPLATAVEAPKVDTVPAADVNSVV
jgi:hypothetical protein